MAGLEGPRVRGRVWDPLVRLFHWTLAIAFAVSWFERSEAAIHETAGNIILALVIARTAWGLIGPASARFETFVKGPVTTIKYVAAILRSRPTHHLGHNPAGAAMIGGLLTALAATTISGVLMKTTALWGNEWVEWIHGTAATVTVWLIAGHLLGIVVACLQHRENLPLSMITGRKWTIAETPAFLGLARPGFGRVMAAMAIAGVSAFVWYGTTVALNGSAWRMPRIIANAAKAQGCEVALVEGPRVEVFPALLLRYDVTLAGQADRVESAVPLSSGLERASVAAEAAFPRFCQTENPEAALVAPTGLRMALETAGSEPIAPPGQDTLVLDVAATEPSIARAAPEPVTAASTPDVVTPAKPAVQAAGAPRKAQVATKRSDANSKSTKKKLLKKKRKHSGHRTSSDRGRSGDDHGSGRGRGGNRGRGGGGDDDRDSGDN